MNPPKNEEIQQRIIHNHSQTAAAPAIYFPGRVSTAAIQQPLQPLLLPVPSFNSSSSSSYIVQTNNISSSSSSSNKQQQVVDNNKSKSLTQTRVTSSSSRSRKRTRGRELIEEEEEEDDDGHYEQYYSNPHDISSIILPPIALTRDDEIYLQFENVQLTDDGVSLEMGYLPNEYKMKVEQAENIIKNITRENEARFRRQALLLTQHFRNIATAGGSSSTQKKVSSQTNNGGNNNVKNNQQRINSQQQPKVKNLGQQQQPRKQQQQNKGKQEVVEKPSTSKTKTKNNSLPSYNQTAKQQRALPSNQQQDLVDLTRNVSKSSLSSSSSSSNNTQNASLNNNNAVAKLDDDHDDDSILKAKGRKKLKSDQTKGETQQLTHYHLAQPGEYDELEATKQEERSLKITIRLPPNGRVGTNNNELKEEEEEEDTDQRKRTKIDNEKTLVNLLKEEEEEEEIMASSSKPIEEQLEITSDQSDLFPEMLINDLMKRIANSVHMIEHRLWPQVGTQNNKRISPPPDSNLAKNYWYALLNSFCTSDEKELKEMKELVNFFQEFKDGKRSHPEIMHALAWTLAGNDHLIMAFDMFLPAKYSMTGLLVNQKLIVALACMLDGSIAKDKRKQKEIARNGTSQLLCAFEDKPPMISKGGRVQTLISLISPTSTHGNGQQQISSSSSDGGGGGVEGPENWIQKVSERYQETSPETFEAIMNILIELGEENTPEKIKKLNEKVIQLLEGQGEDLIQSFQQFNFASAQ